MMRRTRLGFAVAISAALAVTGCGTDSTSTPAPNGLLGGAVLPDLTGQHLEVIGEWTEKEQEAFQAVLKNFTDQTHATVTYTSGGNNVNVLIKSRLAGGAPPDVALIPEPGVVAEYARSGRIKPLTGEAAAAVQSNFSPAWQKLGTVDGQQYGFFFKVANKSVIWYRTDAFSNAGVSPPTTWEELTNVSRTLADSGTTAMAIPAGDGWPVTDWFENIYVRVAGVDRYNKLTAHQLRWTDPTVVQSLELLANYVKQQGFVERGATQLTFTQSVVEVFGTSPKAAMLFEGDFVVGEIHKSSKVQVGTQAKFFNWPSIRGSEPSVVTGGDEAIMFKDSPASQALMAYLAGPQAAVIWAARGGFLTANKNMPSGTYPDDTTRQIGAAIVTSSQVVFDMSDQTPQTFGGQIGADEWKALTDFIGNPSDPAGTASRLEAAATKDYGSK
jgi:ABC-type glycerol-3-phosphate transport system substrate-binding protein